MAYNDPDTGINRDKYGNEVVRNPSGTDPRSGTSFWTWVISIAFAAALILVLFNMAGPTDSTVTAPNERPITEPLNRAPPPTTP